jgi:hypothetical protein
MESKKRISEGVLMPWRLALQKSVLGFVAFSSGICNFAEHGLVYDELDRLGSRSRFSC